MLYKKFFFTSLILSNILLSSTYVCGMDHHKLSSQGALLSLARLSAKKILNTGIAPAKDRIPKECFEIIDLQKLLNLFNNNPSKALLNICC